MAYYDAILFDFDGVLIDSEPIHWKCWSEVLAPLGVELDWETYRKNCIGVADRAMIEFLASRAEPPVSAERLWQEYPRKKHRFLDRVAADPPFPTSTVALLGDLQLSYKLAVVSSSGSAEIEPLLRAGGLRHLFAATVYGEDVKRHKPAPEPYLLAASRLGAMRPLVVEDSVPGVESARAAGFDVVRVEDASSVAASVRAQLQRTSQRY
jgi:beta-phosphoglucomutase